ncbi:phosphate ABC transporter permease PstA [Singulisphaera acidiphila]|uniref:Phosphate transport system permease protein PstA n=1 Tax=Singulisphaera acidiphila (strain ATCC BAA-1392 / DSM 18658 / VKM B-2454 / MOB10) TaxID=886293 RepID=L0DL20_SINAD|nr:phosphate ABC transporter permease PstA [Singulisphaera acidiphila]AGA29553.1 phosphate ABC transporter, permease protein PstA [Singulisphaera acidiphila DSM 18658]
MSVPGSSLYAPHRRTRRLLGPIFGVACFLATLTGVVVLSVVLGAVIAAALRRPGAEPWYAIGSNTRSLFELLWGLASKPQSSDPTLAGFRAGIAGSMWLLGLVAVFAIPVGVGAAVFLEEYAPPGLLRRIIQTNIANLAGVPSIVYGILGLALFVRAFGMKELAMGRTLLAGSLTLSLLVLPVIVIATQEALRTVPNSLRQAALALGATRWQMVRDHVLPAALPGILTGTILGLSRAIGETAPLLMVGAAGSIGVLPHSPFDRYTVLPVEIYNYAKNPKIQFQTVTAGGILILLVLLLTMNATAIVIRNRYGRPGRG